MPRTPRTPRTPRIPAPTPIDLGAPALDPADIHMPYPGDTRPRITSSDGNHYRVDRNPETGEVVAIAENSSDALDAVRYSLPAIPRTPMGTATALEGLNDQQLVDLLEQQAEAMNRTLSNRMYSEGLATITMATPPSPPPTYNYSIDVIPPEVVRGALDQAINSARGQNLFNRDLGRESLARVAGRVSHDVTCSIPPTPAPRTAPVRTFFLDSYGSSRQTIFRAVEVNPWTRQAVPSPYPIGIMYDGPTREDTETSPILALPALITPDLVAHQIREQTCSAMKWTRVPNFVAGMLPSVFSSRWRVHIAGEAFILHPYELYQAWKYLESRSLPLGDFTYQNGRPPLHVDPISGVIFTVDYNNLHTYLPDGAILSREQVTAARRNRRAFMGTSGIVRARLDTERAAMTRAGILVFMSTEPKFEGFTRRVPGEFITEAILNEARATPLLDCEYPYNPYRHPFGSCITETVREMSVDEFRGLFANPEDFPG